MKKQGAVIIILLMIFLSGCGPKPKIKSFLDIDSKQEVIPRIEESCPREFTDTKSPHTNINKVSETWKLISYAFEFEEDGIIHASFMAPEILKIGDSYKMFLGTDIETRSSRGARSSREKRGIQKGISLFESNNLETWTFKGMVYEHDKDPSKDLKASHPWVIEVDNGYRMFYQLAEKTPNNELMPFTIWSAFSKDGESWTKEGLAIGNQEGLTNTGHGRAQKLDNGDYIMVFSADTNQCDPPGIMLAKSKDGKNWDTQKEPLALYGHDPTIMYKEGVLKIYYKYLDLKFFYIESSDKGKTFSEPKLVVFLDENGNNNLENPNKEGEGFPADIDYDGERYMWSTRIPLPREPPGFVKFEKV